MILRPDGALSRGGAARRPGPMLLDLAAGRDPRPEPIDEALLHLAGEHRMTGLLRTWTAEHGGDREAEFWLTKRDMAVQAHQLNLWSVLESSVTRLQSHGIDVATLKGVTAQARYYGRPGERPCSDVDLLISPHQTDRVTEAVATLQPHHPWAPYLDARGISPRIQAVTLQVEQIDVDLHLDPFKLGIATRQAAELWDRTLRYPLPGGATVRVLDDTSALLHFLVHLNKDRFQRLLGFADVSRIMARGEVDWVRLQRDAHAEGIEMPVVRTLETVLNELGLRWPEEVRRPEGPRAAVWGVLWHRGVRLRGSEGRLRYRWRQSWIAILARGRGIEAVRSWLGDAWPSRSAVELRYADIQGPYLWKLLRGRMSAAVATRIELARLRQERAATGTGDRLAP